MDSIDKDALREKYPSNSKVSKTEEPTQKEKRVERVVTGEAKFEKKSLGKRLTETFLADDAQSVWGYIIQDVLIPAGKSMVCDIVGWGGFAEMLLFGDRRGGNRSSRGTNGSRSSFTNYNGASYSYGNAPDPRYGYGAKDGSPTISPRARARHDFSELSYATRGQAEDVLQSLIDLTIDYQVASVQDLYVLSGIEPVSPDDQYGWDDLRNVAPPHRLRSGRYAFDLPRPKKLD